MIAAAKFLSRATRWLALALVLLPGAALAASAEDALSDGDRACLDCHGSAEKAALKARDGRLAPVIDVAVYARSVHADAGCDGCHDAIELPAHPGKLPAVKPVAAPAAVGETCRSCHGKVVKAYARSFHAQRLLAGRKKAPDCNDCHTPHAVMSASVQEGPSNVCLDCHDDPAQTHEVWLPNAARHLQAVACVACHAPGALPRVDLRLAAGSDLSGRFEELAQAADANRDGLDAHEFRTLLQSFERLGTPAAVRGRIELRSGVAAHAMPDKATALRDCFGCHDPAAAPYKSVSVSTLDAQGTPVRYEAQREILTSAVTVEALKGFYVLGGTRLAQLDWLLAAGLVLGISVPGLHFLARRVLGRHHREAPLHPVRHLPVRGALAPGAGLRAARRVHQVGAVPLPLLAAACDGGAHAGVGLPALGDDGEVWRVPAGAPASGARRQ